VALGKIVPSLVLCGRRSLARESRRSAQRRDNSRVLEK